MSKHEQEKEASLRRSLDKADVGDEIRISEFGFARCTKYGFTLNGESKLYDVDGVIGAVMNAEPITIKYDTRHEQEDMTWGNWRD